MCGFTGIALSNPRARVDLEQLRRMTRTLEHRGPDDEGLHEMSGVGLGFRRLSIIDLAGGHQPILNETGDIAVVCNGEIYNFEELRAKLIARGHTFKTGSDVETIVHLYEDVGADLARELVGMFAFCVLDTRDPARPKILLGRDRLGIKPLYWAATSTGLIFGSEPKALLASGLLPRNLRAESLVDYLVQGYVSGDDAAWEGMSRLAPASTLSWTPGSAPQVVSYWDLPLDSLREPADEDEILEWVDRVVRDHLVSDVPLGAFLSGGIDSSAVIDAMARARGARGRAARSLDSGLVACSVGFKEKEFDELTRARATAARLGATHHTRVLEPDPAIAVDILPWFFDEPLADPSTVPTYLVSKMAREHVTVALSGDGGDEVFAGYRRYVFDVAENKTRALVGPAGRRTLAFVGRHYPKLDWAPRFLRAKHTLMNFGSEPARAYWNSVTQISLADVHAVLAADLRAAVARHDPFHAFQRLYERPRIDDPLYRAQYADVHGFLPDQILVKSDRAAMATSLEVRPPFLDHRFVERFIHLPATEKVRAGRGKHAFREALRSRLPADVLDGRKMGFDTPLRAWLKGPLSGTVAEAIETLPERWFDRAATRVCLAEHVSGARDRSALLWSLLVLEHWRRRHEVRDVVTRS
ncbi:MAG: asparagine synthase (glutamine-hydrolyzing) [Planctomycetota bacterium]|nr:asparagine synthase (glutamine-hydrolyzing) [Planctomycetota bacterium]